MTYQRVSSFSSFSESTTPKPEEEFYEIIDFYCASPAPSFFLLPSTMAAPLVPDSGVTMHKTMTNYHEKGTLFFVRLDVVSSVAFRRRQRHTYTFGST